MFAAFLAVLAWLLPHLVTIRMTRQREVSKKWMLIIAASAFLLGPLGILAAYSAKRFSKYEGKEFQLKNIDYNIKLTEAKIRSIEQQIQNTKFPWPDILPWSEKNLTKELEQLQERLVFLTHERVLLVGDGFERKDKESAENQKDPQHTSETKKMEEKNLSPELSPEEKKEKQQKARNNFEQLNQPVENKRSAGISMK